MASLIKRFGLHDALRNELYAEHVKTDAYIVDRAREALQVLKQCGSEEQRQHYRVGLTILAPQAAQFGDRHGMASKVAERLKIKRTGAPFRDSVAVRADIDAAGAKMQEPLAVGKVVVVHGHICTTMTWGGGFLN